MSKHVYTKEQLDGMSNVDLTIAVAKKLGVSLRPNFDPLSNYNDCMPIVDKYEISIVKYKDGDTYAFVWDTDYSANQPTIQRAIVYCYLMMEV